MKFVLAVAYHFCLSLPATFSQPCTNKFSRLCISRLISVSVSRECEMRSTEMESERSAGANLTVSDEDAIVTLVLSFRPGIHNSSSTCQAPRQAGALCAKRGGCTLMKLCHNCIQHASCGLAHCLWICRVRRDLSNKIN